MLRVSTVLSFSGEGMLQCDKQTSADFPKHAEILELILAEKQNQREIWG